MKTTKKKTDAAETSIRSIEAQIMLAGEEKKGVDSDLVACREMLASTRKDLERFKSEYAAAKRELDFLIREKEKEPSKIDFLEAAYEKMTADVDAAHKAVKDLSERSIRIIDHLTKKLQHYEHMKEQNNAMFVLLDEANAFLRKDRSDPDIQEWYMRYKLMYNDEINRIRKNTGDPFVKEKNS